VRIPHSGRLVLIAALLALATAGLTTLVAGCSEPSSAHWSQGPGQGGGASAGATKAPGDASPTGSASPPADAGNPFAGRVPAFPAPPPPQPVTAAAGPLAPIYKRLPVNQPVAFLTMDDGWTQLPEASQLMLAAHIPFTMFLIAPIAAKNPAFFKQLAGLGGVIEDHTITHPEMKGKPYAFQHHEICDAKTSLESTFGSKMRFFRPPFGDYDQNTLKAVHDCGLQAAFYWSETVNNGTVYYQTAQHRVQPGDIILMHFRPAFVNDVIAALTAIHNAGLTPALLENYIG
jgi:peptidoglycan/xylan/chitin deacetylase (PgdA/CDA1 family)